METVHVGSGREATRGRLLLPAAIAVANTSIFLFQIMLARITEPAIFGEALAVLAVLLILEAPTTTLQALVSRTVQENRHGLGEGPAPLDLGGLVGASLIGGIVICGALAAAMPLLREFLHLSQTPFLIAVYALPLLLGVVPKGVLAGMGDYMGISTSLIISSGVRLVVGTALVHAGYGLNGAIGAVVIGEVASALVLLNLARRRTGPVGSRLNLQWRDSMGEGISSTGFWVLSALDVILVQHYLAGPSAGLYGSAATTSQLVMIIPMAGASWLFPRLTGTSQPSTSGAVLIRGLVSAALVGLAVAGVVALTATPLIRTVYDGSYLGGASLARWLVVSTASLGVVTVLVQYLLSRQETLPASLCWLGIVGFAIAIHYDHASLHVVAIETMAAAITVCVIMTAIALHGVRYLRTGVENDDLATLDADLDLTIVVPYYNPGETLAPNLRRLLLVLEGSALDYEVVAVSDGSTDGSDLSIGDLQAERLRHVALPYNQGKGAALRMGLIAGRGRYLGFIDADGDLDPKLLEAFVALTALYDPDVVIGSKRHPLSDVHYPPMRWLYSIGFQYLVRLLFHLNVRDTQTGIKLVRRDVLATALPRMLEKRFAFDLELLVVARRLGYRRFLEAPVTLRHQFKSTVSVRSVWHTMIDTMAIFYRLRFLHTYDRLPTSTFLQPSLQLYPPFVRGNARLRR